MSLLLLGRFCPFLNILYQRSVKCNRSSYKSHAFFFQNVKYSVPLKCNPRMPLTFTLPIRFQQTSDPDAVEFSVRTQFLLLARKDVWLSNNTKEVMEQSDAAFSLGKMGKIDICCYYYYYYYYYHYYYCNTFSQF